MSRIPIRIYFNSENAKKIHSELSRSISELKDKIESKKKKLFKDQDAFPHEETLELITDIKHMLQLLATFRELVSQVTEPDKNQCEMIEEAINIFMDELAMITLFSLQKKAIN